VVLAAGRRGGLAHDARATEQPVHGGHRQREPPGLLPEPAGLLDHHGHGVVAVLVLEVHEQVGHILGDRAGLADVLSGFGPKGLEAAGPVDVQPVLERLHGHPRPTGAGNAVGADGLLAQALVELLARLLGGWVQEVGDQTVAEQGHVFGAFALLVVHGCPPGSKRFPPLAG
jgi:hypothetical protein